MPQQANITIKKKDGTTDQVWTAVSPSAGDGVEAEWRNQSVGTVPAFQPKLTVKGRKGGANGLRRKMDSVVLWPITATVDGKEVMVDSIKVTVSVDKSETLAAATTDEAIAQALNLFSSTHHKDQAFQARASV